uniref:Carbonic anhydrase n=1 Tax=Sycon raphanus TaxID=56443 RepID=I2FLL8_9METZ|nr:carbonic anhydrase [Sycon raphanus]
MKSAIVFSCLIACATAASWSYNYGAANGPNNWGMLPGFSTCGNGTKQTPIDIVRASATRQTYPTLSFSGATNETDWTIQNNGHSVAALPTADIWLSGGPLGSKVYKVYNIHIHFGNSSFRASEHSFDGGQRTTGEFHVVTYDRTFSNIGEAVASNRGDALSVFGVLFQAQTGQTYDAGITSLINMAANLTYAGDDYVDGLDFSTMVSALDLQQYYSYMGSLTTPGCAEVVSWIVANRLHYVSPAAIDQLMSLKAGMSATPGIDLQGNTRPLQALNGRTVSRSFDLSGSISTLFSANIYTLLAALLVAFLARN